MPKKGLSVTLDEQNLLWLKSRTLATKGRSLSETLDALVTAARKGGDVPAAAIRSVAGTIDIAPDDPGLDEADATIGRLFAASVSRPFLVRETPSEPARRKRRG